MIQEGRIDHLETIANEIEQYEQWESKWDIQKIVTSICGTLFLTGIGLLLGENNLEYKFWISVITVASFIGFIANGISVWLHHEENKKKHAFRSEKIKDIIRKVKESLVKSDSQ